MFPQPAEIAVSEFYKQRRTSIKDGVGLVAFIFGWFAAAPFAWPYISEGFDVGDPAKGVLRFFFVVLAVGALSPRELRVVSSPAALELGPVDCGSAIARAERLGEKARIDLRRSIA